MFYLLKIKRQWIHYKMCIRDSSKTPLAVCQMGFIISIIPHWLCQCIIKWKQKKKLLSHTCFPKQLNLLLFFCSAFVLMKRIHGKAPCCLSQLADIASTFGFHASSTGTSIQQCYKRMCLYLAKLFFRVNFRDQFIKWELL